MFKLFNKQWKRIVEIVHINEFGFAIDTYGVAHDTRALRLVRRGDERVTFDI